MVIRRHFKLRRKPARSLGSIERDILQELSLGDMLYAFLLSGRSTKRFFKLAHERAMYRYRRKLAIERLMTLEYIRKNGEQLSITSAGKNIFADAVRDTRALLETKSWDHKWRIAAFDIPEKYAPLRDKIRALLKRAGFAQLQRSIWIFPHECEEFVQLIRDESRLSKYILYGVLDRIGDQERLKKIFHLHA